MVATRCMTYNHSLYIEETLHGFAMQETTFPIVFCVVDDASTDGEQGLLLEWAKNNLVLNNDGSLPCKQMSYGNMIFAKHIENNNAYFAMILLDENHYRKKDKLPYISEWSDCAKYIALCEGDDYWIDKKKLQKQVDFMENHPDYGMCHTDFSLSDGSNRTHYQERYLDGNYFPGMLLYENVGIGTLTVLYRKETFDKTPKYYLEERFVAGDKPLWIELAKEAKIKYLLEVMACYRVLPNSASHSQSFEKSIAFREGLQNIRRFYADKYNIKLTVFNNYYTNLLKVCYQFSNGEMASKYYNEAKAHHAITKRGLLFYLGAKYALFRSLLLFVASRW